MLAALLIAGLLDPAPPPTPSYPLQVRTLENGLKVILQPDRSAADVTVNLRYRVGALHEPNGTSGMAHLLEHLMFQGSRHVPPGMHDQTLAAVGGTGINAFTTFTHTEYVQTIPPEALERALWMESDRMGFFEEGGWVEHVDREKGVVRSEEFLRLEDRAYGRANRELWAVMFPEGHPLHYGVSGDEDDRASITLDDLKRFHAAYYGPNNATLVVVGRFDMDRTTEWIERYFGTLPARPVPRLQVVRAPKVPRRTLWLPAPLASMPRLSLVWDGPAPGGDDAVALEFFCTMLKYGYTSREFIVNSTDIIVEGLDADLVTIGDRSWLRIDAYVTPGADLGLARAKVDSILETYAWVAPPQTAVDAARRAFTTRYLDQLSSTSGRAGLLQRIAAGPEGTKLDLRAPLEAVYRVQREGILSAVGERISPGTLAAFAQPLE